ncbi:MAG: hypothetical protein JWO08_1407 [Verrucomicrobiaceae bacterium]|nr:hypothetical protein [Verrucomicrobiaceae bacterium]
MKNCTQAPDSAKAEATFFLISIPQYLVNIISPVVFSVPVSGGSR